MSQSEKNPRDLTTSSDEEEDEDAKVFIYKIMFSLNRQFI